MGPHAIADEDLVERLRRGEDAAFVEAYSTYANLLYRTALRVLRDADEAADVVQETFVTLAQRVQTFEGRSRLSTWLYRVAYRHALQRLRSPDRRRRPARSEGVLAAAERTPDMSPGPAQRLEQKLLHDGIDEALALLPESLRAAFVLRDIEGMSTAEAADALHVSESALKVRLHRARLRLRERLSDELLPPETEAAGLPCATVIEQLSGYLDGDIDQALRARIEAHVAECSHCRVMIDSTQRTLELAGEHRHLLLPVPRSAEMLERLRSVFASRRATG